VTKSISMTLALGGLLSLLTLSPGCGKEQSAGGGPGGMPPMPVEVAEVLAEGMADEFRVIGSLSADFEITVVTEIAATVLSLPFQEGKEIRKGEFIARLDDVRLSAEVQRAEALVQQRLGAYKRVQIVVEGNAGAPQDLDDAAADLAVAQADLEVARSQLSKTRIVAPFRGIAGERLVSQGSYLRPGDAITDLAQIDRLRVIFSVPELYLGRLDIGAPVLVRTSAQPDLVLQGTVDVIDPILDRNTRSAKIVAHIDNPAGKLRPGMSAEVTVVLDERPQAITVPSEAVFFQGQQAFVYVIGEDSTVGLAPISLGTRGAEMVEVIQGLQAGQTVVRTGHQKLVPGARVMPVGQAGPPSAGDEGAGS
jgi:membrane fusion protein (multidrug efflux system)